jgi:Kef-type K+ transport system membrane component KefB
MNIYLFVALILILGFILGRILRRIRLTEILAYILAGIIISSVLHFEPPAEFNVIVTGVTLALVAYTVGLSFSFGFLRRMGKKVAIILVVEVLATSVGVWGFVYLLTKNLPLSIVLGSLAPATAPAGTIAVFRDLRSKGTLTDVSIAIVGLDDAAGIVIYSVGILWARTLLGGGTGASFSFVQPAWEIFGGLVLGGAIGVAISYAMKRLQLSSDHIFVISLAIAILCWGLADLIGVSPILTCMALGTAVINFNVQIGRRSSELIDNIMTPIFVLFFAAIGMDMDFSVFHLIWPLVAVYCVGRSVGKIAGCGLGGVWSGSEPKIKKYLGLALLNQAGVAIGLASLAAQALSNYNLGGIIITIMATTTAVFGIVSPLGTQYAVRKAGEANI